MTVGKKTKISRAAGFTLVEILVVITIIAILAGLSMSGVMSGKTSGQEGAVRNQLTTLAAQIENYCTDTGDYPPSSLMRWGVRGNGLNDGIECVLACLQSRKHGHMSIGDLKPDLRTNLDEDVLDKAQERRVRERLDWSRQNNNLYEYCDRWGNPLVYIHSQDYGKQFKIRRATGDVILVSAKRDPDGGFFKPTEFQLWSLGVDEENDEYGDGDDLCHWQR